MKNGPFQRSFDEFRNSRLTFNEQKTHVTPWPSSAAMITQRWRKSPWARMRTTSVWMRSRTKYGHGGLAVIDVTSRRKIAEIDLKTHPEGFQLDQANNRIFVNDP